MTVTQADKTLPLVSMVMQARKTAYLDEAMSGV